MLTDLSRVLPRVKNHKSTSLKGESEQNLRIYMNSQFCCIFITHLNLVM